jgi:hypothetical protein
MTTTKAVADKAVRLVAAGALTVRLVDGDRILPQRHGVHALGHHPRVVGGWYGNGMTTCETPESADQFVDHVQDQARQPLRRGIEQVLNRGDLRTGVDRGHLCPCARPVPGDHRQRVENRPSGQQWMERAACCRPAPGKGRHC